MPIDIEKFKRKAKLNDRYAKQLQRLRGKGIDTGCIEKAVDGAMKNLAPEKASSLVIYGEPQSGKTEMMICLTAKLLDSGHRTIVHLMNDSVDLLTQNLRRFKGSGLAPAPRGLSELVEPETKNLQELVVFCKKNGKDLKNLIKRLKGKDHIIVIDDEADYATPNAKINQGTRTKINRLVGRLMRRGGSYIGVTATPARLNLNNTLQNDSAKWVRFPSHGKYTGQDIFFPTDQTKVPYRLTLLPQGSSPIEARKALVRFLVTVAYLNTYVNRPDKEENYTMLVHTSGRKEDHEADRVNVEKSIQALRDADGKDFAELVTLAHSTAEELYPKADPDKLTEYVVANASRTTPIVLNSKRDRKALGDNATEPSSPFTVIIGGNIVSRGVTFPNLLSMFFTRDVRHKLQQDTYIQRARMFGARGAYLKHFELTIPPQLYADWQRCFIFHKLALNTIDSKLGSPVWIGDNRISVASDSSINKATVVLDKGEMSFGIFDFSDTLDETVSQAPTSVETLRKLRRGIGNDAVPQFLIEYIDSTPRAGKDSLAIHTSSPIAGYKKSANQKAISRKKGFIGNPQLELNRFPNAVHHIKIFRNAVGKARLFYKLTNSGSLQFIQNLNSRSKGK